MIERDWKPVSTPAFAAAVGGLVILALMLRGDADGYLLGLDDLNLAFHEAGHLIFGVLGSTLGLYGGTLGQLVFPAAVAVSFFRKKDAVGLYAGIVWFCENLLNIARYMGDARLQALPLLGGGEHDWTLILSRWGLLAHDTGLAGALRLLAWAGMAAAAFWLFRRWNESPAPAGDAV